MTIRYVRQKEREEADERHVFTAVKPTPRSYGEVRLPPPKTEPLELQSKRGEKT
jgi:hypothetical protein